MDSAGVGWRDGEKTHTIKCSSVAHIKRCNFTGATIKDTWTKSRGRVEVGEGGGIGKGGWRDGEKMQTNVIE